MSKYWENYWNSIDGGNLQQSVGRTKFGRPINERDFQKELLFLKEHLKLGPSDTLVDLCAGNGLITKEVCGSVRKVYAIDFSEPLLNDFVVNSNKINLMCHDINNFDFSKIQFNKLIWYFSIQHFSYSEVINIIKNILDNISLGGIVYIGDIPDINKKWEFYSEPEYKKFFFDKLLNNEEHIGTCFQRDFFKFLLNYLGYHGKYEILDKPEEHFNNAYRFDLLISK